LIQKRAERQSPNQISENRRRQHRTKSTRFAEFIVFQFLKVRAGNMIYEATAPQKPSRNQLLDLLVVDGT
jgi:hypothetical protein